MSKKPTKSELKAELLEWIESQNWNKKSFYSIPIRQFVEFSKKGMKHTINRHYKNPEIELMITKDIMKILPNSHYISFDKNKDSTKKNVIGTHNYYDIVLYENVLYEVWLKVKETKDRTYFYDHGVIRKL